MVEGGLATSGQVEESQTRAEYANITILQPSPFIPTSISIWKAFGYWKSFYGKRTPRWTNAWEKMLTFLLLPVTRLVSCPFSLFFVLLSSVSIAHLASLSCCQCCPLAPSQLLPDHPSNSQTRRQASQDCGFSRRLCFELDSASTKFNPSAVSIRQAVGFFLNPKLLIVIYQFGFGWKVGKGGWEWGGRREKDKINGSPSANINLPFCGHVDMWFESERVKILPLKNN